MQKRTFITTVFGLAAAFLMAASAQAQVAGKDYVAISPPQPTENLAKIEVIEFFSYGCPHCKDFHPLISKWAAKLPPDVVFKRVPISFGRAQWANLGKLYYTAEAINELGRLDNAAFIALHEKGVKLYDDATINQFAVQEGVDGKKFAEAYGSFGVQSKMKRADQLAQGHKVQGVPAIAVDGRYMVLNEGVQGYEELLARADKVIGKVRSEKKK